MGRRRETIPLPEPIIHRIQFLLTPKEAARTTVISKSWHSAWLTRPNLDLDETEFRETRRPNYNRYDYDSAEAMKDGFSEFAKKNIQRYVKSNLRIETFRLSLKLEPRTEWEAFSLSYELVLTALNLGAKHLDLKLNGSPGRKPFLPHEVLGAENLVGLCVEGYTINDLVLDQKIIERGMKGHYSYPSNFFHGLHDLEEAYMQAPSDEAVGVWRLLTGEFCSDIPAFASPDSYGKKVRFLLKWKET